MTEHQIKEALNELVNLVALGKPMEAFEKFYHDDVEKTDLDGIPHKGKKINEKIGHELLAKVKAIRDFTAVENVVKGNRSFLIWSLDFDHEDHGRIQVVQVAIQDWQDGKIIRERFVA